MKRSKARNKESENRALYQQFLNLERDWASFKQSNKPLNFPQISAKSDSSSTTTLDFFKLLENSPRSLMSSLQNNKSPLGGLNWQVKKNDLAVEEIIRDRRTALASGKLKGRCLFGESDEKSSITTTSQEVISEDEICSDCLVLLRENMDGKNNTNSCSPTSSFSTEKASKDHEIRMVEGDHKASVNLLERKNWRYGTCSWLLVMVIFAISVSAFTQGIFFIAGEQVEEVIPLPT
ncbi:hypothetical protein K7X08_024703 [Anisodus acutangulus]|uniref:Uncharacterized protein n=1 Tax=Anisodus acutangulus TaxID=402998 RepID=A0A9Q1M8B9_9SOLA|nr:hypothetical protein K7X08_024703 [Anisodus acutangulus]